MRCHSETLHFWYSRQQADTLRYRCNFGPYTRTYCRINDKVLLYTECAHRDRPFGLWDDYVYLGEGVFDHAE